MEHSIMLGTYAALNLYPRLLPEDDTPNYESFRWFIGYCTYLWIIQKVVIFY